MTILIIPDSHAKTAVGVRRYKALGKLINDYQPETIVQLGDWADMESLSSYDRGKKAFEGRRYRKDIDAANSALEVMHNEIKYKPKNLFWLWGNHEHRIDRAIEESSHLEGVISKDDILARKQGGIPLNSDNGLITVAIHLTTILPQGSWDAQFLATITPVDYCKLSTLAAYRATHTYGITQRPLEETIEKYKLSLQELTWTPTNGRPMRGKLKPCGGTVLPFSMMLQAGGQITLSVLELTKS